MHFIILNLFVVNKFVFFLNNLSRIPWIELFSAFVNFSSSAFSARRFQPAFFRPSVFGRLADCSHFELKAENAAIFRPSVLGRLADCSHFVLKAENALFRPSVLIVAVVLAFHQRTFRCWNWLLLSLRARGRTWIWQFIAFLLAKVQQASRAIFPLLLFLSLSVCAFCSVSSEWSSTIGVKSSVAMNAFTASVKDFESLKLTNSECWIEFSKGEVNQGSRGWLFHFP